MRPRADRPHKNNNILTEGMDESPVLLVGNATDLKMLWDNCNYGN